MKLNSRKVASTLTIAALLLAGSVRADSPLQGAWRVTESTNSEGVINEQPQPALFIFTTTHYSILIATGNTARPESKGDRISDIEKLGNPSYFCVLRAD